MIRIPYGLSNFTAIREEGYHFVDRTAFLRKLEQLPTRYHFFLRPRRFGKSLWLSIMEHYYDRRFAPKFEALFGELDIGREPTEGANQYLVLKFDFSGIDTSDMRLVSEGFLTQVKTGAEKLLNGYPKVFSSEDKKRVADARDPSAVLQILYRILEVKAPGQPIFLLIDEYDHFTNRLLVSNREDFLSIVAKNGFYRAFFEAAKTGTQEGSIDRIFITGVSPVTLDSLTSGFNIGHNLTLDPHFHDMLGFHEPEVETVLRGSGILEKQLPAVMDDVRYWYNGYLFSEETEKRLYNPDMVLYFAREYQSLGKYPKTMLDINIASDYGRIVQTFYIGDTQANVQILETLLEESRAAAELTIQFSMEKMWTQDDFLSLLFYNGLVTIKDKFLSSLVFEIPNNVIRELYFRLFRDNILKQAGLQAQQPDVSSAVARMALHNDPRPFFEMVGRVLEGLDNRDYRNMSEKHIKSIAAALLFTTNIYFVRSEHPVGNGYVDLLLLQRPTVEISYQSAIELKYVKKSDAAKAPDVLAEAKKQMQDYLTHPDLKVLAGERIPLKGWVTVLVGAEVYALEEIND
jgi:hypothetical protein